MSCITSVLIVILVAAIGEGHAIFVRILKVYFCAQTLELLIIWGHMFK